MKVKIFPRSDSVLRDALSIFGDDNVTVIADSVFIDNLDEDQVIMAENFFDEQSVMVIA